MFGDEMVHALKAISREPDESYKDFIRRCAKNELAARVKLNDLADNMDPARQNEKTLGLMKRYEWAKSYIEGKLEEMES